AGGPASPRAGGPDPARSGSGLHVAGSALTVLALLLIGVTVQVTLLSQLRHARSQQTAYADFRAAVAEATAPVGQTGQDGALLAPGTAVAVLRIPALGVRQVVFEGTAGGVLQAGPGHRRDTPLPGQPGTSVLMGRRATYGAPFAELFRLNSGDEIQVVTGQGEFSYRVLGVRHAGDLAPQPLEPDRSRLTLMTADGPMFFPTDVLRVDADLTDGSAPAPAPPRRLTFAGLPDAEQAMAGDPAAWMPLVLWAQALCAAAFAITWARRRWGAVQAWVVGVPVLGAVGVATADTVARLLPNVL
ncbi:sortase, partial [Dactylosporangium fulvum]|uniref:sortase n=1 Tax=Dactylosporangium fulvum TaxID=53359 RepID=UPI0031DB019A